MKAVVVASGDLDPGDLRHLDGAGLVVAADGGVLALQQAGCRVDRVVGDLDSVDADTVDRLVADGVRVERHAADKDASDTELAVRAAVEAGAEAVVLLAALGGQRLDHELANVLLLVDPDLGRTQLRLVRGGTTVRAVRNGGTLAIEVGIGDVVTLLPVGGDVAGVTARGLRWPLEDATLRIGRSRGLSNVVAGMGASVHVEHGTLLVVEHTPSIERGVS